MISEVMCYGGPRISLYAFPLDDEIRFFICLVKIWFLEKYLESLLVFVGKNKIRKKNPKCDSWRKKISLWKTESGSGGQITY